MTPPHRPRKRFSQNFLVDAAIIESIVRAVSPRDGERIIEIGPGLGALTRPLSRVVQPLHVVEIDRDIAARLRETYPPETLIVHEGDALEFDFGSLGPGLRVVGNLPYHISTPLLFRLAECVGSLKDAHVMLQAEVVARMVAPPGASDYGRLSVMLQYVFEMERVLEVPPSAFRPVPKVDSAVVRMMPREAAMQPRAQDFALLSQTVATAFAHRRKTLRNTLGHLLDTADFGALGIDPQARAQTLSVADFIAIANHRSARGERTAH